MTDAKTFTVLAVLFLAASVVAHPSSLASLRASFLKDCAAEIAADATVSLSSSQSESLCQQLAPRFNESRADAITRIQGWATTQDSQVQSAVATALAEMEASEQEMQQEAESAAAKINNTQARDLATQLVSVVFDDSLSIKQIGQQVKKLFESANNETRSIVEQSIVTFENMLNQAQGAAESQDEFRHKRNAEATGASSEEQHAEAAGEHHSPDHHHEAGASTGRRRRNAEATSANSEEQHAGAAGEHHSPDHHHEPGAPAGRRRRRNADGHHQEQEQEQPQHAAGGASPENHAHP